MSDKPILFSGPMIRALLDGRKTQTRRILKPQPPEGSTFFAYDIGDQGFFARFLDEDESGNADLPFAKISAMKCDRLWVREAHYMTDDGEAQAVVYTEDDAAVAQHHSDIARLQAQYGLSDAWARPHLRIRPSIHMPRWASRLTLIVTDVRVQRLQDISEADAVAEGSFLGRCKCMPPQNSGDKINRMFRREWCRKCGYQFRTIWDSIYGHGAWDANQWVAAYTFTVHRCNIDQICK